MLKWGIVALVIVVWLGGCASSARVIPGDNGEYVSIGTSVDESGAYDAALDEGKSECQKQGKRFVMVKHQSVYQGMDKNAKTVVNVVGAMSGHYGMGSSRDDHKVELVFRCK